MNASSLSQYDGWTEAEVVARNSHELTALHLMQGRAYIVQQREEHVRELAKLRETIETLTQAGRIVALAHEAGRKTVRVADVIRDAQAAQELRTVQGSKD